jgi:SAM-dependent methyltransferase
MASQQKVATAVDHRGSSDCAMDMGQATKKKARNRPLTQGLRDHMFAYYNERAPEYEEAYTRGTGTASITDPTVFTTEIAVLEGIVRGFGRGHLLDLACGTGYWLPCYIGNCSRVTLFDQSERMLVECERTVGRLAGADQCSLVRGDVFDYQFPACTHDSALVGFLLSHLSDEQEHLLMQILRQTLRPDARVLILESAWTDLRARFNEKMGRQLRRLNDGTEFDIYKRYIGRDDITAWESKYGLTLSIEHFGEALCAVSGSFREVAL